MSISRNIWNFAGPRYVKNSWGDRLIDLWPSFACLTCRIPQRGYCAACIIDIVRDLGNLHCILPRKRVLPATLPLTSFVGHHQDGGLRSQTLGIEHLHCHLVLRVRLQVLNFMALQEMGEFSFKLLVCVEAHI